MNKPAYLGNVEALVNIGNFEGNLPERKIVPLRCNSDLPGLILKEYVLEEMGKFPPSKGDIVDIWVLLEDELKSKNLAPLSGIGFSIISNEILNVCRWDAEFMDVVVPQIYTLEKGLWVPQKVEKVGAFCSGEKKVYDHENKAWLRYLNSKRTGQDKIAYLNDFLSE